MSREERHLGAGVIVLRVAVASYVGAMAALMVGVLAFHGVTHGLDGMVATVAGASRTIDALMPSWTPSTAAVVNGIVASAIAWMLVQWRGWDRRRGMVDVPLAIPAFVTAIGLVVVRAVQPVLLELEPVEEEVHTLRAHTLQPFVARLLPPKRPAVATGAEPGPHLLARTAGDLRAGGGAPEVAAYPG